MTTKMKEVLGSSWNKNSFLSKNIIQCSALRKTECGNKQKAGNLSILRKNLQEQISFICNNC